MQNENFKPQGYKVLNYGGLEIEINNTGEAARVRSICQSWVTGEPLYSPVSKWLQIKYTPIKGRAYIKYKSIRHHLDEFIKIR